ncbi:MAG TPA: multidrug ABC transporter permease [Deltaproteobacteria bacterium]|nr:MAG: multidrug ABC transporter permease [Deltaproteobacteria bacterium GWA2_55_82]OGQ64426.1 MAG: multidrug ABC transporter permease [Deltaproteobacteria bacterium RIFCSPLOWO2_02_FULL_55_12]OIJ72806.1 MAG: multidrug ABC transporter permease [Deltaproteobacteria bacterium GWC2_55_46]HBG46084.1 multidrug ABC transporter permease [Deltaproteobacteria bacterium]HCY11582.1 multidrug ABC transporter permease [Deltaproteobacteria bacterium]
MPVPLVYSYRSLWTRKLTTALTAGGMALVVFVFAAITMLAEGLERTLVETGSPENMVVVRKGAPSEVQSSITREQAAIIETTDGIAAGPEGKMMAAKEIVVLISLPKRGTDKPSNVVLRGISSMSAALKPQARLVEGRMPRPGTYEIAAGRSVARRFKGAGVGETIRFAMRDWKVVGLFDAGATGFSSEIWGDIDSLMQAFRRPVYTSVVLKMADPGRLDEMAKRIESDPRLKLEPKRETEFYAEQSKALSTFLRVLGTGLTAIFSTGAIIGAMITMYSAVANRVSEIGTLRAIGFGRPSILAAFLAESLLTGLIGGAAGLLLASFLQFFTISTLNFQTFAELAFSFTLTLGTALESITIALAMGLIGGLLPAVRASKMKIVDALRTV